MATTTRTLLILEDDPILNTLYKVYCEQALQELPHIEGIVKQAFAYDEAKIILKEQPADFISVDIALSQAERGKTESQRTQQDAGGMSLLKEIQEVERQPFVVVVTGETLQSYAIDAYQEYGVLAFYQKDRFDSDEYRNAIKAALWYLDTAEFIQKLEIDAAIESWNKALEAARIAGIKERNFENLGYRIKAMREGLTHSITELPMGQWTDDKLKGRVVGREQDWTIIRVIIKEYSNFVSVFPSQEKPILSFIAELLKQTRYQFQDDQIFIGHLGHREHIAEPTFVLLPGQKSINRTTEIANWLGSKFAQTGSRLFAPDPELMEQRDRPGDQAEPTFSLEISLLPNQEYTYFSDLPLLLDTLGSAQF